MDQCFVHVEDCKLFLVCGWEVCHFSQVVIMNQVQIIYIGQPLQNLYNVVLLALNLT